MSVRGTYLDGKIVLEEPLAIANGELLTVMLADEEERCADGSHWPITEAEVEAWCRRIPDLPPLFDDEASAAAFDAALFAMCRAGLCSEHCEMEGGR